jgi:hypothetical protein
MPAPIAGQEVAKMSDKTSVKWHEIINAAQDDAMPFFDLYREYAEAVREKEARKREAGFWPHHKV